MWAWRDNAPHPVATCHIKEYYMNVERFRTLAEAIRTDNLKGAKFAMNDWGLCALSKLILGQPLCGTPACIAGSAVLLFGDPKIYRSIQLQAAALLELESRDAVWVFTGAWSPNALFEITNIEAADYLDLCANAGRVL